MDITIPAPAPVGSTESAAPQVTTPSTSTEQTTPQAEKPAGLPQAETPAGESTADAASDQANPDQSQEGESKSWKEKRQERNRQRWQEYKQAKEVLPARLAVLESEVARLRGKQPPDFSQIVDPNEELAERTAWKVRQTQAADAEARLYQERQLAAQDQQAKLVAAWEEKAEEARARIPDFDQVVTRQTPIHDRMSPFLVESEKGAEIAYWLGKNPNEAWALHQKFETAPAQALVELGRLEARLSAPAPKTTSTAPRPAQTLNGGANPLAFDASRASADDMAAQLRKAGIIR